MEESHVNNEDLNYEGAELEDKLLNFFGEGGTFKDLKNMSHGSNILSCL